MKRCFRCQIDKPEAEFYLGSRGKLLNKCKDCCLAMTRAARRGELQQKIVLSDPPTRKDVELLLHYDPETGVFTRKVTRGGILAGSFAGTVNKKGYRVICLDNKYYKAHRIAWLLVYGIWPTDTINHKNGCKDDNRIANLEDIPSGENTKHAFRSGLKNTAHLKRYWASRRMESHSDAEKGAPNA